MSQRVVLVTGPNGFLANEVCKQLVPDFKVIGLTRENTKCATTVEASYDRVNILAESVPSVDIVMHLAACIPKPIDASFPEIDSTNVGLVDRLVATYPNARHILASSVAVYGTPRSLPISLGCAAVDPTHYGVSKLKAESVVKMAKSHAIIRFSSIIGVGMKPETFIPKIVISAKAGAIRLIGDGRRLQNYIDVRDAAAMCISAIDYENSFVALGIGDRSHSNEDIAKILSRLTGAKISYEGIDQSPSFLYDDTNSAPIGRPRISIEETLDDMVNNA